MAKPRRTPLEVAVPASYSLTEHGLQTKTVKWGLLARLLAVFRTSRLYIYVDRREAAREAGLARLLIGYMLTAPYLRKKLYPLDPRLRYAGLLPPLQLPIHGVGGPRPGECREALVERCERGSSLLDAGLGAPARLPGACPGPGRRVVVCIEKLGAEPVVRLAGPGEVYTGFRVELVKGLRNVLRRGRGRLRLATSRRGSVAGPGLLGELASEAVGRGGLLVLFGAPDRGLYEIAASEGLRLEEHVDYVVNTVPGQGTRTVRTEEAVAATLALLNLFIG